MRLGMLCCVSFQWNIWSPLVIEASSYKFWWIFSKLFDILPFVLCCSAPSNVKWYALKCFVCVIFVKRTRWDRGAALHSQSLKWLCISLESLAYHTRARTKEICGKNEPKFAWITWRMRCQVQVAASLEHIFSCPNS